MSETAPLMKLQVLSFPALVPNRAATGRQPPLACPLDLPSKTKRKAQGLNWGYENDIDLSPCVKDVPLLSRNSSRALQKITTVTEPLNSGLTCIYGCNS
jgi:hypothetical protein